MSMSNGYPVLNYVHIQHATALTIHPIPGANMLKIRVFGHALREKSSRLFDRLLDNDGNLTADHAVVKANTVPLSINPDMPASDKPVVTVVAGKETRTHCNCIKADVELIHGVVVPAEAVPSAGYIHFVDSNIKLAPAPAKLVSTTSALTVNSAHSFHATSIHAVPADDNASLNILENTLLVQSCSFENVHVQPGHACTICNWIEAIIAPAPFYVDKATQTSHAETERQVTNQKLLKELYAQDLELKSKGKQIMSKDKELKYKDMELRAKDCEIKEKDRELAMSAEKLQDAGMAMCHLGRVNAVKAEQIDRLTEQLNDNNLSPALYKRLSVHTPSPTNRRVSTAFSATLRTGRARELNLQGGKEMAESKDDKPAA